MKHHDTYRIVRWVYRCSPCSERDSNEYPQLLFLWRTELSFDYHQIPTLSVTLLKTLTCRSCSKYPDNRDLLDLCPPLISILDIQAPEGRGHVVVGGHYAHRKHPVLTFIAHSENIIKNNLLKGKPRSTFGTKCALWLSIESHCRHVCAKKYYCKFPKYSDIQKICCNHSKIWTMWLYHRVMSPSDADRMANSVDPDRSSLIWVCTVCPGLSVRKLRIIRVVMPAVLFEYAWLVTSGDRFFNVVSQTTQVNSMSISLVLPKPCLLVHMIIEPKCSFRQKFTPLVLLRCWERTLDGSLIT